MPDEPAREREQRAVPGQSIRVHTGRREKIVIARRPAPPAEVQAPTPPAEAPPEAEPWGRAFWKGKPVGHQGDPRELNEGEEIPADASIAAAFETRELGGKGIDAEVSLVPEGGAAAPPKVPLTGKVGASPGVTEIPWRVSSDADRKAPDATALKAYAKERLDVFRGVVKEQGLFAWWSDHAHEHAEDIGAKMRSTFPLFLEPYAVGFPKPEKPEDLDALVDLAYWCGYLHDVGMSGCASQHTALGDYATRQAPHRPGSLDYDTVQQEKVSWAFLKDEGFRKRHAVHSGFWLFHDKGRLTSALSPAQVEKLAIVVSLHSKSLYTKLGVRTLSELADLEKARDLIGGVHGREGGGSLPPLGPWFSKELKLKFDARIQGLASALDSPSITAKEWKSSVAMARCLALADGLRKRGSEFKDSFSNPFKKLPLDRTQIGRRPFVHSGSCKLPLDEPGVTDKNRETYAEVVGDVLEHFAQKTGDASLRSLKPDPASPFTPEAFARLAPVFARTDNRFLVPPDVYPFNLGEIGILATDLVDPASEGVAVGKCPLLKIKIDGTSDPAEVAQMAADVLGEVPYTMGTNCAVLLEAEGPHDFVEWFAAMKDEFGGWYKADVGGKKYEDAYRPFGGNPPKELTERLAAIDRSKRFFRARSGAAEPLPSLA